MLIRFFLYSIYRKAVVPCRSEHIYTTPLHGRYCLFGESAMIHTAFLANPTGPATESDGFIVSIQKCHPGQFHRKRRNPRPTIVIGIEQYPEIITADDLFRLLPRRHVRRAASAFSIKITTISAFIDRLWRSNDRIGLYPLRPADTRIMQQIEILLYLFHSTYLVIP